jgi:tetrapyrrole methylase family protein/MazG family protein
MAKVLRPRSPLERSVQLQEHAADEGLDWSNAENLWSRINEELAEAKAASEDISILGARIAVRQGRDGGCGTEEQEPLDAAHRLLREELGDLLFAVVDVCRMLGIDPREALETANDNFDRSMKYALDQAAAEGMLPGLSQPDQLKAWWLEARRQGGSKQMRTFFQEQSVSYGTA